MQKTPEEWKKIVKECVETEKRGEDVIEYLRGQGYIYSAESTWRNIQKRDLKRSNITNGHPDEAKGTKEVAPKVTETATAEAAPEETVNRRGRRKKAESETEILTIEDAERMDEEKEKKHERLYSVERTPDGYEVTEEAVHVKEKLPAIIDIEVSEKERRWYEENVERLHKAVIDATREQVKECINSMFDERSTAQIVIEDRKEGVRREEDRFRVMAVGSEMGKYRIVEHADGEMVEFKRTGCLEAVAMTVDGWKVFLEEMPEALKRMGVWG